MPPLQSHFTGKQSLRPTPPSRLSYGKLITVIVPLPKRPTGPVVGDSLFHTVNT